jgi:IS30 family transposase
VSREVAAVGGRAHQRAQQRARRPKTPKLTHPPLAERVSGWLAEWWSPVQISARLRIEFPGDPMMWVSHETIYQALYVQGRGELRRELARCLRTGRAKRRPRGHGEHTGQLRDMVMISQRPAEADDRAVPGHWEGTCSSAPTASQPSAPWSSGPPATSSCCTCPPAATRTWSSRRCGGRSPACPGELARTITWDQGKELAFHADFTIATDIPVYFCDPHKPWQRGSNENTNGLLRQYLPKGPTCRSTLPLTLLVSPAASTTGPARPSDT